MSSSCCLTKAQTKRTLSEIGERALSALIQVYNKILLSETSLSFLFLLMALGPHHLSLDLSECLGKRREAWRSFTWICIVGGSWVDLGWVAEAIGGVVYHSQVVDIFWNLLSPFWATCSYFSPESLLRDDLGRKDSWHDSLEWMCLYSNHEKGYFVLSMADNQEKRKWQVLKIYRHRYHEARITRALTVSMWQLTKD